MATHDYVIANGTGAAVRSDLNNALAAIVSNNSSSTEPGTTYAYQWWADTNANVLKLRNSANDGWITLRELDGTMLIEDGTASAPGLAFADDVNTGIFSPAADAVAFTTGGTERVRITSTGAIAIEGASNYGTSGQVLTSNGNDAPTWQDASGGATDIDGLSDGVTYDSGLSLGLGTNALANDDGTDNNNTAVGYQALQSATSGSDNTALGNNAGNAITTGSNNVAIGKGALVANTSASENTAVGRNALTANTTGGNNTALGADALDANQTGGSNVAVGKNALGAYTASNNVAIGVDALASATSGGTCVAVGNSALKDGNGIQCTAVGQSAGENNTANFLTAFGYNALLNNTGADNTAFGHQALDACTSGYDNTAVGKDAGGAITTAVFNTHIGHEAGSNVTTGGNLTCIGRAAQASSATASNEITLGNNTVSTLRCNTQTISSLSDGRDKTEVEDLPLGLDFIDTLRPVKFKWDTRDGNGKDGTYDAGFIAQDLQSAQSASDAEYLKMVMDSNPDRLEAAYGQLIPVLVKAVQDLSAENVALKARLDVAGI